MINCADMELKELYVNTFFYWVNKTVHLVLLKPPNINGLCSPPPPPHPPQVEASKNSTNQKSFLFQILPVLQRCLLNCLRLSFWNNSGLLKFCRTILEVPKIKCLEMGRIIGTFKFMNNETSSNYLVENPPKRVQIIYETINVYLPKTSPIS